MVGKVANRAVAKYYRGIPKNIREKAGLDRATYLDSAKTELAEIAQKYDPTKKDKDGNQVSFDRYMANTGMQRLNALATKLGVESSEQGVTQNLDSPQAQQVAVTTTGAAWELVDKADQTTEDGIVFADLRLHTDADKADSLSTGGAGTFSTIKDLLSDDFLDPDAPDPDNYPQGILAWNTRRSGYNVKEYKNN